MTDTGSSSALVGRPPLELWIGFAASLVAHLAAVALGGYGQVLTIVPLAVGLVVVDLAALGAAVLQLRDDRREGRRSHWLVWAIVVAAGSFVLYALYVGIFVLLVRVLCISELCRSPIR